MAEHIKKLGARGPTRILLSRHDKQAIEARWRFDVLETFLGDPASCDLRARVNDPLDCRGCFDAIDNVII